MAWMKRRTPTTPSPATTPAVQFYNPNQHSNQDWQQPTTNNWYNQQPAAVPQTEYNQQPPFWQQPNPQPAQQTPQQPPYQQYQYNQQPDYYQQNVSYDQNFTNNGQQWQSQQPNNAYPQQPQHQAEGDSWNWGWGDEDNSNTQQNPPINTTSTSNTNVVESFANDESWNWNVEESTPKSDPTEHEAFPKMGENATKHREVKSEPTPDNYESVSLHQLPAMPTGKRNKIENLTPQWSTESQLSQESSDDVLQTSESDKSHVFSRSSTISHSPISGQETPLEPPAVKTENDFESYPSENKEILVKKEASYSKRAALSSKSRNYYQSTFVQSVNLETVPDNSEQPDTIPTTTPATIKPLIPDNNEIAPINDRNQYLETGQLSDENTNQSGGDNVDALPPTGLVRMVLGQIEPSEPTPSEPPPGLHRMVLGQTEKTSSPPVGLHRMVPGESSSPEVSYLAEDDYVSEAELNQLVTPQSRSATIGADTPPINGGGSGDTQRETVVDGANSMDADRRASVEGDDINVLVNSVRDLTVGENPTDVVAASVVEDVVSSDSDGGERKAKDKRYEQKERHRERYSPDYGKDKRSDRRRHRDRYYEDDTDYYSDKDRGRRRDERDRRDDYEKKYGSLRKDKYGGKEPRAGGGGGSSRRERDPRDGREYSRRDYYYNNRYEDEYDDPQRSRPTSRSDSMHDPYRDRNPDRDHRRRYPDREHKRHNRDPFNAYAMQGYNYDPYNPYYQQYQYFENMRRTNPQAYAEWYRKYYPHHTSAPQSTGYAGDDKASVHSGRSSTNDELAKERYLRQSYYGQTATPHSYYREQPSSISGHYGLDESRPFDYTDSSLNLEDSNVSQRLTPAKFSTAHIKAGISSGKLIKILPNYPIDGQSAAVEVQRIQAYLSNDGELKELEEFPGPLIKGVTHKKTIIEYCENKIKNRSLDGDEDGAYVLMWELLILLLRQNGMVVGADIAELLMKDRPYEHSLRPSSVASNASSGVALDGDLIPSDGASATVNTSLKEEFVTNKFREYLLYGSGKEALEWAMKNGLWGHALFLASKLDKRTYASVMMRFANGLPMNDPLQTLYQLLSGRLPAAVTSVGDEKWGDWRPHLAMILSNTTQRPELDRKAISTLADTLMQRGSLYAAQFCYLMAEVGFSRYGTDGAKIVLLGANHAKPFAQFATNDAIHMTEIYEYACSLNDPAFNIPEFQAYKYLIATRLADRGFLESSLAYLEQVAGVILQNPSAAQPTLVTKVCDLADRLKYYDPVGDTDDGDMDGIDLDSSRPDNSWLRDLKVIQQEYNMGLITHQSMNNLNVPTPELESTSQPIHSPEETWHSQQQFQQQQQQPAWSQPEVVEQPQQDAFSQPQYHQQDWEQPQQQQQPWSDNNQVIQDPYISPQAQELEPNYWNVTQNEDIVRPQISMPNQSKSYHEEVDSAPHADSPAKPAAVTKPSDKKPAAAGWFGGIFSRLAMRPKNQMKLPDDKNPTIVWDQEKKRWVNLEEDSNDTSLELKPPPKMVDFMPKPSHVSPIPATTTQPQVPQMPQIGDAQPNMFKLQRNRNLKKSYVDVFNPSGLPTASSSANFTAPAPVANNPQMNFFIPAPAADPNAPMDFLTPAPLVDPNTQAPPYQS